MDRDETDHPKVLNSPWECGTCLHNINIINNADLQTTKPYPSIVMYTILFLFPAIIFANGQLSKASIAINVVKLFELHQLQLLQLQLHQLKI